MKNVSSNYHVYWNPQLFSLMHVGWHECTAEVKQSRVSLRKIEPLTTFTMSLFPFPLRQTRAYDHQDLSSFYGMVDFISWAWERNMAAWSLSFLWFFLLGLVQCLNVYEHWFSIDVALRTGWKLENSNLFNF